MSPIGGRTVFSFRPSQSERLDGEQIGMARVFWENFTDDEINIPKQSYLVALLMRGIHCRHGIATDTMLLQCHQMCQRSIP